MGWVGCHLRVNVVGSVVRSVVRVPCPSVSLAPADTAPSLVHSCARHVQRNFLTRGVMALQPSLTVTALPTWRVKNAPHKSQDHTDRRTEVRASATHRTHALFTCAHTDQPRSSPTLLVFAHMQQLHIFCTAPTPVLTVRTHSIAPVAVPLDSCLWRTG